MFWRDTGISEEVEEVEARDTGGITMTDMMAQRGQERADSSGVSSGAEFSRLGRQCLACSGVCPSLV